MALTQHRLNIHPSEFLFYKHLRSTIILCTKSETGYYIVQKCPQWDSYEICVIRPSFILQLQSRSNYTLSAAHHATTKRFKLNFFLFLFYILIKIVEQNHFISDRRLSFNLNTDINNLRKSIIFTIFKTVF